MAVLRAWITPQNRVGLREHPERAWLFPADETLVNDVDDSPICPRICES
jgi:hypothetical protein